VPPTSDTSSFDLIVIGAGINGAAIAREAALSGLRVLILERGDVAGGTSSASSRLIHGGLRYLEHFELGLVRESLGERERLLRCAPHLVAPLELCIPIYARARRGRRQIQVGLTLYDWLSFDRSLPGHRMLDRAALLESLPGLSSVNLVAGASYFDAQVRYPERLVLENVWDALRHGALLKTYTRATGLGIADGRVQRVEWSATDGTRGAAAARVVVNAAGPWVDEVVSGVRHRRLIGGTKGSHLIVPRFATAPTMGVYVEAGSDGRPFFILPWNELLLIGTTDERFDGDAAAATIDDRERAYLAGETERVFPGAAGLAARVLYTQTGVRPLPHHPRGSAGAITRRHLIRAHTRVDGLYSIVGGKLTTHRALAEDVLRKLRKFWPNLPPSPTRERRLPGALDTADRDTLLADIGAQLGARQAARLWNVYGAAAAMVAARARDETECAVTLAGDLLGADLEHAVTVERAVTLEDILQRRCMVGLNRSFGCDAARAAAGWLVSRGHWDASRAAAEVAAYRTFALRHHAAAANVSGD
jgi:glycerol-3-phosphate dehydrogenase